MKEALKPAILSALILSLASFGDAFLYPVLPSNAQQLNVPLVWVGFLLSINRFVRLIANQAIAWLFGIIGHRNMTIVAALIAGLSTLMYALASNLVIWIIARVMWGLCYSALRISCVSYSLVGKQQGFLLGLSRGLQETGPILALIAGPLLSAEFGLQTTFVLFAAVSLLAIFLALKLPDPPLENTSFSFSFNPIPTSFNALVFLSAFVVEGMLIVLMGNLLKNENFSALGLVAIIAVFVGYRRLSNVIVSPLAGKIADHLGIERLFVCAVFLTAVSMLLVVAGFVKTGLIMTFTLQSVSSALAPGVTSSNGANRLQLIAANATWRDLGTASGALAGGFLLIKADLNPYLFLSGLVMISASLYNYLMSVQSQKQIINGNSGNSPEI